MRRRAKEKEARDMSRAAAIGLRGMELRREGRR